MNNEQLSESQIAAILIAGSLVTAIVLVWGIILL